MNALRLIDRLLVDFDTFEADCAALEYTDTGEAWVLMSRMAEGLRIARRVSESALTEAKV